MAWLETIKPKPLLDEGGGAKSKLYLEWPLSTVAAFKAAYSSFLKLLELIFQKALQQSL